MAKADPLAFRVLAARGVAAVRAQWRLLATAIAIDASPHIALDFTPGDWTRAAAFLSFLTLYLQLLLTIRTTAQIGAGPPGYTRDRWAEGRYPAAFLLSVLVLLGIGAGLLVLVVPGLLLWSLWSIALPALVAERLRVTDAMRRSWRLVRPRLGRFVALNLLWALPYVALVGAIVAAAYVPALANSGLIAAADLFASILLMTGAVLWATIYGAACEAERFRGPNAPPVSSG